jgi:hypothetical protein
MKTLLEAVELLYEDRRTYRHGKDKEHFRTTIFFVKGPRNEESANLHKPQPWEMHMSKIKLFLCSCA